MSKKSFYNTYVRYTKIYETGGYDVKCDSKRYKINLMYSLILSFWHFYITFKMTNEYRFSYSGSQSSVESKLFYYKGP